MATPRHRPRKCGKLTAKQEQFCAEYIKDLNASQAVLRAGYNAKNPNRHGSQLLRMEHIAARIAELMYKRNQRVEIDGDRVLQEIAKLATIDPAEVVDPATGHLLKLHDMPAHVRRAVSSIEVLYRKTHAAKGDAPQVTSELVKVKFWDKTRSLELLCRHLGLLNDRSTVNHRFIGEDGDIEFRAVYGSSAPAPEATNGHSSNGHSNGSNGAATNGHAASS